MIGVHISSEISQLKKESQRIKKHGFKIIQLFLDPIQNINLYYDFIEYVNKHNLIIVVHTPYTLNISSNFNPYIWWLKYILQQIKFVQMFENKGLILHLGKKLNLTKNIALDNMEKYLLYIFENTTSCNILIETSSGQGSEMCYKLEDLAVFVNRLIKKLSTPDKKRFGICLDTCHIFSAGYDISTKNKFNMFMSKFDKLIGIDKIKLVHLNDSKYPLGSKKDRHESLGKGYIGDILYYIANFFIKKNISVVLETPFDNHAEEIKNIITFSS